MNRAVKRRVRKGSFFKLVFGLLALIVFSVVVSNNVDIKFEKTIPWFKTFEE